MWGKINVFSSLLKNRRDLILKNALYFIIVPLLGLCLCIACNVHCLHCLQDSAFSLV